MLRFLTLVPFLVAAGCAGEDGADGVSSLTDVADEPAGANCAVGGVRIDSGVDADGDGTLDAGEIAVTRYVCRISSSLTNVAPEAAGTNCAAGGVKIETGPDTNGNGTLDGSEVAATHYVCGSGEAQVVKAFNGSAAGFPANTNASMTMLTAEVTTTTGGEVLAIGSADIYCTPGECPAGNPAASGYMWISDGNNVNAPIAEFDYFFMMPSVTESLTRTARFPIAAAGTHAFNLRGEDAINAFTFYRPSITLVFLP